jgi:Uma2 family endonuclease
MTIQANRVDLACRADHPVRPRLSAFSAPQPDLVLLKYREDDYCLSPPSPDDVLLVVEVSESSPHYDRKIKLPLYARHDAPEVWIVDVECQRIHFFHSLRAGHYTHTASTAAPGRVSLQALPGCSVDLTGVLDKLG